MIYSLRNKFYKNILFSFIGQQFRNGIEKKENSDSIKEVSSTIGNDQTLSFLSS